MIEQSLGVAFPGSLAWKTDGSAAHHRWFLFGFTDDWQPFPMDASFESLRATLKARSGCGSQHDLEDGWTAVRAQLLSIT
jgi:hypothetical protein